MLKKSFLIIALLTVCLFTVSAQDTARLQQLEREMTQLTADFQAGKITLQQYQQRAAAIAQEIRTASSASASAATSARDAREQQIEQASAPYRYTDAQVRRLTELMDQGKSIETQEYEGRITKAQAEQRYAPIKREIDQIYAPFKDLSSDQSLNILRQQEAIGAEIKKLWPGAAPGWPRADEDIGYVKVFNLSRSIRQAPGTRASWSRYGTLWFRIYGYAIFQTGANPTTMEDLKRQIESITGKPMQRLVDTGLFVVGSQNGYYLEYQFNEPNENGWYDICYHNITLVDGTLRHGIGFIIENIHSKERKEIE